MDGPGVDFFWASGEVALQAQGIVGGVDEFDQPSLISTVAFEEFLSFFIGEILELVFEFGRNEEAVSGGD